VGVGTGGRAAGRASPARRLALKVLRRVDEGGAYVNLALDEALDGEGLSWADRALATELVYGVTRWRGRLDWALGRLCDRPLEDLPVWIRNILRMGLYQLAFLERVPVWAAVAESVSLAREFGHRGTAGLVNAVLRRAASEGVPDPGELGRPLDPAVRLAVEHSHPEWLVRRWLARLGEEKTRELLRLDNEPARLTLRVNSTRTDREGLARCLAGEGVEAFPGRLFPEALHCRTVRPVRQLRAYAEGLFSVQDEGAMAAARTVAPRPGWLVVDACAGVGGKSTHLAELMGGRGRVVAVDLFEHKLALLERTAQRLGLHGIQTRRLDARELGSTDLAGAADAVLVDAPCSGLGVLRRRPDLRWRLKEKDFADLVRLQGELLEAAAACVKRGGVLVYATCSLEPEENEGVVEGFLARNLEFAADEAAAAAGLSWSLSGSVHRTGSGGRYLLLWPERGGHDGFFVARMVRLAGRSRVSVAEKLGDRA